MLVASAWARREEYEDVEHEPANEIADALRAWDRSNDGPSVQGLAAAKCREQAAHNLRE